MSESFRGMPVLVTGAAGVIGTELVRLLEAKRFQVIAADIKPRPESFGQSVEYIQGDLNETLGLLETCQPRWLFHLAATFERTEESWEFSSENFHNNVVLSHAVLRYALARKSLSHYVFASSYLVYEPSLYLDKGSSAKPRVLDETININPRNLIGASKLFHESELRHAMRSIDGLDISVVRIFRGFGIGSRDVISRWIRGALEGHTLSIFNQNSSFDYCFAPDSARGLFEIANNAKGYTTVNLGSGRSTSIQEVAALIAEGIPEANFVTREIQMSRENSVADLTNLTRATSWKPATSMREAIFAVVRHEKALRSER